VRTPQGVAGRPGIAGLSVLTVDRLAELIAAAALTGAGRRRRRARLLPQPGGRRWPRIRGCSSRWRRIRPRCRRWLPSEPYARLLAEHLGAAGITANGTAVRPVIERAFPRTLLGLLRRAPG